MILNQWFKNMICFLIFFIFGTDSLAWASKCTLKDSLNIQDAHEGFCHFDVKNRKFKGTQSQQAACLTRKVKRMGFIGTETITKYLKSLLAEPAPSVSKVQALLELQQIKTTDVGGDLNKAILANYFIIHDTSTPNCSEYGNFTSCKVRGELPKNRDDITWIYNKNFGGHPKTYPNRSAHVFTNRVGASITEVNFADHIATTKFESCYDSSAKKNLFIGIENIQPRIGDPSIPRPGKKANDYDAPDPGFTSKQYARLALIYIVASARSGQWLIPAFHAVLDQYYKDGHDDPQNFDMEIFSDAVRNYNNELLSIGN